MTFFADGVLVASSYVPTSGQKLALVLAVAATGGTPTARVGLGSSSNATGTISLRHPQLNLGPTALPYVPTTSAAVYAPAVDWLAAQGVYGLRSEAAATNLVLWSTAFDDAAWNKTDATITANAGVAPDGTTTADLLYPTTTGTIRGAYQGFTAAATTYTASIFAKAAGKSSIRFIEFPGSLTAGTVDLSTGAVTGVLAGYTFTVSDSNSGWRRIQMTAAATAGTRYLQFMVTDSAGTATATVNGTDGVLLWGAQIETGSRASSPILTLGATATRAADALVVPLGSLAGLTEGTLVVDYVRGGSTAYQNAAQLGDGTANNRIDVGTTSGLEYLSLIAGGSQWAFSGAATISSSAVNRSVIAFKVNDTFLASNGASGALFSSGAAPSGVVNLYLGTDHLGRTLDGGVVRRVRLTNRRLPNAAARGLTA
jgi:hypothetical protein